jgi:hypothetical protein
VKQKEWTIGDERWTRRISVNPNRPAVAVEGDGGSTERKMTGTRVLGIGLDPYTIDFDTDFFRGKPLNADVIARGIKADEARVRAMGHEFEWLLIDARGGAAKASAAARAALARRPVEVVVIGGGVRLDPAQTPVLEALVNAVIEAAPGVRIAFNTSPTNTAEAIARAS